MSVFERIIAICKYKKIMKNLRMQLEECMDLYQRNNVSINKLEQLIVADKKLQFENCKPMTNKEKIQAMSTEELAFLLSYFSTCDHCIYIETECARKPNYEIHCVEGIAAWLEQEAKS